MCLADAPKVKKKDQGNIALFLCLGLAVLAIGSGFYLLFSSLGSSEKSKDPKVTFEDLKREAEQAFANPVSVDASLERNSNSFACLYSGSADCTGKGGTFLFYPEANSQPISQLLVDGGLSRDGASCRGFPSEFCPFRVESTWTPVCKSNSCEDTKSFRIKIKVVYNTGPKNEYEWQQEKLVSPTLHLSQAAACQREGKVWAETECISTEQAARRNIASDAVAPPSNVVAPEGMDEAALRRQEQETGGAPKNLNPADLICPELINLEGRDWNVERIAPGRAQVRLAATNGCPGAEDLFTFECRGKFPAAFEREGQWTQVDVLQAPSCDGSGNPPEMPTRQ